MEKSELLSQGKFSCHRLVAPNKLLLIIIVAAVVTTTTTMKMLTLARCDWSARNSIRDRLARDVGHELTLITV